jgi:hypothetical protein
MTTMMDQPAKYLGTTLTIMTIDIRAPGAKARFLASR